MCITSLRVLVRLILIHNWVKVATLALTTITCLINPTEAIVTSDPRWQVLSDLSLGHGKFLVDTLITLVALTARVGLAMDLGQSLAQAIAHTLVLGHVLDAHRHLFIWALICHSIWLCVQTTMGLVDLLFVLTWGLVGEGVVHENTRD